MPLCEVSFFHTKPENLAVSVFAEDDSPEVRRLSLGGIKAFATPQRQALLEKLLDDPDEPVRRDAQDVRAYWNQLRDTPPSELILHPRIAKNEY